MPSRDLREFTSSLVQLSRASLDDAYLARLDGASRLERTIREKLREWVQAEAAVELANLLRQQGEELIVADNRALARAPRAAGRQAEPAAPQDMSADWPGKLKLVIELSNHPAIKASENLILVKIATQLCWPIDEKSDKPEKKYGWTKVIKFGAQNPDPNLSNGKLTGDQESRVVNSLKRRRIVAGLTAGQVAKYGGSHEGQQFRIRYEAQNEWKLEEPPRLVNDAPPKPVRPPSVKASCERRNGQSKLKIGEKEVALAEGQPILVRPLSDGKAQFDVPEAWEIGAAPTAKMQEEEPKAELPPTAEMPEEGSRAESPTAKMPEETAGVPGPPPAKMQQEARLGCLDMAVPDYQGNQFHDPDFGWLVVDLEVKPPGSKWNSAWTRAGSDGIWDRRERKEWERKPAVAVFNHLLSKINGGVHPRWEEKPRIALAPAQPTNVRGKGVPLPVGLKINPEVLERERLRREVASKVPVPPRPAEQSTKPSPKERRANA